MKNPWMSAYLSAWHSAANQMTATARGMSAAQMTQAQAEFMRQWMAVWVAVMMPWTQTGKKRR